MVAVTAWYNGLGYEYYLVDGVPYRENKGRIRLQEIPEGTIVQWTFTYELGGIFGGMRDALSTRRQVDHTIAESLKTLWQKIKQTGSAAHPHEAKSLMRDAPNVQARSAYLPRHPAPEATEPSTPAVQPRSGIAAEPPIIEGDGQPIHVIDEPPIAEEDTRPRHPVAPEAEPPEPEAEPEFLDQVIDLSRFEPPRDPSDTQPRKPVEPPTEAAAPPPFVDEETELLPEPLPEVLPNYAPPLVTSEPEQPTAPADQVAEETQPDYEAEVPVKAVEPETPITEPAVPTVDASPVVEPEAPTTATAKVAEPEPQAPTAEPNPVEPAAPPTASESPETKSIWEIFGVPRPSETGPMPAASLAQPKPEPEPAAVPAEHINLPPGSTRAGLRIALRRKLAHVRRS